MPRFPVKPWLVLVGVWVISAGLAVSWIDYGWIPHDEGTLAQSAERVLAGELPHRDFDEGYTGGLSFLNASAFRLFGVNLLALRIPLLCFFLAWVPALFYIASRFVTPLAAGATVLLAVAWSVPNYAAPMPSWYNLFFAVFAAAAVLRHVETNRRSWLVLAGVCAGLSCLVKIVGLYLVAAVLLFLAFREQLLSQATAKETEESSARATPVYSAFALFFLLVFIGLLVALLLDELRGREFVHFILPSVALAALFAWNERLGARQSSAVRFATLIGMVGPFAVGFLLPVLVFLVPYVAAGSLSTLGHGVFVQSLLQLGYGHARPPSLLATTVATTPLVLALGLAAWRRAMGRAEVAIAGLALLALLVAAGTEAFVYRLVWYSVRALVPVVAVGGVLVLMRSVPHGPVTVHLRQQILVLLCVLVLVSLTQFPFSTPIYFLYVAPVLALTVTAVVSSTGVPRLAQAALLCFYLFFAVLWVNGALVYTIGFYHNPIGQVATLDFDRGGLRVSRAEKDEYEELVAVLRARSRSDFIYATPDCPEVYFLSGLRNPTPTFFDFYDDPEGRTDRILRAIERTRVDAVALNREPSFSGEVPPDLSAALRQRFPESLDVGRFEVRWRE